MTTLSKLLASLLPVMSVASAANAESFCYDGIIYNVTSDSTCEVGRQTPDDINGDVALPAVAVDEDGKSYVLTAVSNFAFVTCASLTQVSIPETVETVGNSSFSKCASLKVVRFLGTPVSVGSNCFSESESIAEVYTPTLESWISTDFKDASASPLNYGATLFNSEGIPVDCSVIPDGTVRIGNYSLSNMKTLETVTIPESIAEIGTGAFTGTPVKYVNITSLAAWAEITFGNYTANPLYAGAVIVIYGKEVTNLDIPYGVTSISNYAFMNYKVAETITVPASVKAIGIQAFSGCTAARSLSIGEGVASIGMNAFQNIDFKTVRSYAVNPPELARNSFSENTYSTAILTVPQGSLDAYMAASQWKKFQSIEEEATTGIGSVVGDDAGEVIYYNLAGQKIDNPSAGTYIRSHGGRNVKVIIR